MKCNIKPRINIPGVMNRTMTAREATVAQAVYDYANKQHMEEVGRLMDVATETMLVALHRRYGYGQRVLREIWEDTIRLRAGLRTSLRDLDNDGEYELQKTGENIEDTAIRMELSEIGVDVRAWEATVRYDERSGEVTFGEVSA